MRIFGVVVLLLGVLSIVMPVVSSAGVALAVGVFLVVGGITRSIWAFKSGSFGAGAFAVLTGGVMVIGGIAMVARPMLGAVSITLVLAVYFVVDGIAEIIGAFSVKPTEGWGYMVFDGAISLLLAWMIWSQWPLSGTWAVGILTGARLVFVGFGMLFFGSAAKAAIPTAAGSPK